MSAPATHRAGDSTEAFRVPLGFGATLAPALHTLTAALEWLQGGFSVPQLWLTYIAFLPVPAIVLGLYAVQCPRISRIGMAGAMLYGFAFVYFAHTALVALDSGVPTYAELVQRSGSVFTAHAILMIAGGLAFGWATLRARSLPAWTAWLFLTGMSLNLMVGLLPLPDVLRTLGIAVGNAGLTGMGWAIVRGPAVPLPD